MHDWPQLRHILSVHRDGSVWHDVPMCTSDMQHQVVTLLGSVRTVWTDKLRLLTALQSYVSSERVRAAIDPLALGTLEHRAAGFCNRHNRMATFLRARSGCASPNYFLIKNNNVLIHSVLISKKIPECLPVFWLKSLEKMFWILKYMSLWVY